MFLFFYISVNIVALVWTVLFAFTTVVYQYSSAPNLNQTVFDDGCCILREPYTGDGFMIDYDEYGGSCIEFDTGCIFWWVGWPDGRKGLFQKVYKN